MKVACGWNVRIHGVVCDVQPGEVDDVDLKLVMDYKEVVPFARRRIADSDPLPISELHGDPLRLPKYFRDLHDALAVLTR